MTFKVGAHVSTAGGVTKAIKRQEDVGGNCGQIFVGAPQRWNVKDIDEDTGQEFKQKREEAGQGPYTIHSTYLVNLGTPKDDLFEKSLNCIQQEIYAARDLGIEYVVFHPGAHTGSGRKNAVERIAEGIDELEIPDGVTLLLENTAGKGTTMGVSFEELKSIIDLTETSDGDIGVCIDTCHAHAAGYELREEEGFQEMLDEIKNDLGLDYVKVLHLNDSKDEKGSEKDNHQHIGEGNIGLEGFRNIVNAEEFRDLPMILETPVTDDKGYAENIEVIRDLRE